MSTLTTLTVSDLPLLTVVQLKEICRENAIKGYSKLKKIQLIELVSDFLLVLIARDLEDSIQESHVLTCKQASPHDVASNKPRSAWFNIGETITAYQGYTQEGYWNGWACPMFTRHVAEQILEDTCNVHDQWSYDKETDTFKVYFDGALDEFEEYQGFHIMDNGHMIKVYAIGSYGWVWDEVQLDNELEYNYFSSCEAVFYGQGGLEFEAADVFYVNNFNKEDKHQ